MACGGLKPAASRHSPYAAHACNSCHDTESSTSFGSYPAKFALPNPPAGSNLSPELDDKTRSRLRYRVDRLCFQCHQDLNPEAPQNRGLWLHGPFRAGVCLGCHDPHESPHPKLLAAYPWPALCARCHPGYHRGKPAPAGDCRSCHSPHARSGPFPASSNP
ncbi:MAG: cytochrome c3 family protein [Elusimicrobiota bacterium]